DLIAAVDADLAAEILTWGARSAKKTEAAVDAVVARHDPDALHKSRESEVGRSVDFGQPGDAPGYTTVYARMFAGDAAAGERTLTAMAYSVCEADPRPMTERRDDALAALLAGITTLACQCDTPDCDVTTNPRPLREITLYTLTDHTTTAAAVGTAVEDAAAREPAVAASNPVGESPAAAVPAADAEPTEPIPNRSASKPASKQGATPQSRPGYIFGAGFIPGPLLTEMLHGARTTVRELIHPGHAGPEPRYTPSRALADFIRCRDLTCRFPGCDTPATHADIDHTIPYPVGPTHASNLKILCRFHHLLKTFWTGPTGWRDRQHPDGTIEWTSPTGHTYTTHPGSRLLFPTLCPPTATLWTSDPPDVPTTPQRGAKMPRRPHTRAHNRTRYITTQRQHTANQRAAERASENRGIATAPGGYVGDTTEYGSDPPPF
ncbi:hypothetical protein FHR72_004118, partial [Mycolicibacterium iranicum]